MWARRREKTAREAGLDAREFYDELGGDYDRMVSWEARLAREGAFFERLFAGGGVRRVLDAACGTGMHLVAFARRGLACCGADLSPAMIEQARRNADSAGVKVELATAPFGALSTAFRGSFDAVTCLGNSLPHLLDDASLASCFSDFAALLRPGGLLVIQNRNYDRLLRERQRFMPLAARAEAGEETLFLRITDFPPGDRAAAGTGAGAADQEAITFTIVTLKKRGGAWSQSVQSTPLRALRRATLEGALRAAGFQAVEVYGSYAQGPFDAPDAADLVAVARR
jgi:SAM-dependent methyltransferase